MAVLLSTVLKERTDDYYSPGNGSFATKNNNNKWQSCRELFHEDCCMSFNPFGNFYYTLKYKQTIDHIIKSLSFYEEKLKIPKSKQIKLQKVDVLYWDEKPKYSCLLIKPSRFWKDPIRHSLLTLIIRESPRRYGGFLKKTKTAIDLFLKGHIFYYSPEFYGWADVFSGKNKNEVKELMSKKPSPNKKVEYVHSNNEFHMKKY